MTNSLLRDILKVIGKELIRQSKSKGPVGGQEFHIESFWRLPDDKEGGFRFEVTTWDEESEDPRVTEVLSYPKLMALIATTMIDPCLSAVCAEVNKN
jgi:hypothetical protein